MSLNQREENTPSPVSKEDGSNKRILINQGNPTSKPPQPPAIMDPPVNTPHVAMEINMTTSGQDGNESINSNPNNNPLQNVIPTALSRQLHDNLYKYKQLETKLTKVEHHMDFLKTCTKEARVPFGLRWNTTVNVMEPNEEINQIIKQHQIEAELELVKIMLTHYESVRKDLNSQRTTMENTLENMKSEENSTTINKSIEDLAMEKQTLSKKLKQKRVSKLKNLQSGAIRVSESYASVASRRSDQSLNSTYRNQQQRPPPQIIYQPRTQYPTDPRAPRDTPPPHLPPQRQYHEREPPPHQMEPPPRQMTPPYRSQSYPETNRSPVRHQPPRENNFGEVVNTFTSFLQNLNQQTGQLLSSLNQLNYLQRRQ